MANKALILLHGALGAKAQLEKVASKLATELDLHLLNFSGHGGQAFTDDFSIDGFSEELSNYVDSERLNKPNVFGYSMGGYVALKLSSAQPDKLGKIMTLGTKFDWTPESAAREVKMLNPEKIEEKVPAFAKALQNLHAPNDWKELLNKTAGLMTELGNGKALTPDQIRSIQNEVLICRGSEDNMVTEEESVSAADALPNGHFSSISGFLHPIEKVDSDILASQISSFIG